MLAKGLSHIAIEMCHTYAPERLIPLKLTNYSKIEFSSSDKAALDARLIKVEESVREALTIPPLDKFIRVGLLDDIASRVLQRKSGESGRWEQFIGISREALIQGIGTDYVRDESTLEERGRAFQSQILARAAEQHLQIDPAGKISIPLLDRSINVPTRGFYGVDDGTFPTCSILDLAWVEERLRLFGRTVTTLPESYRNQQLQVAALAALIELPKRECATTAFLDPEGRVVETLNFGEIQIA